MLINNASHCSEKMQRCQEYIDALEEECRKIQVFKRELPLCLELVTQAIEACKQQISGTTTEYLHGGQSECSEQTSSEAPVLEEFIPVKRVSCSDDERHFHKHKNDSGGSNLSRDSKGNDKSSKKSDWLRSVQLWNQTLDPPTKEDSPRKVSVMEVKRNGTGAFHPFKREKNSAAAEPASTARSPSSAVAPAAEASSTAETGGSSGGGNKREEKEGQSQRKARRSWSPELHRRFLQALQQLGGSHAATPKQIRELMMVDGLTNDEVKSHLQKYRLHTRRPGSSINNNHHPQAPPQFVVVGGIWVPPPPEYAAVAAATTAAVSGEASGAATPTGIYAPVATLPVSVRDDSSPSLKQRQQQHERLQCKSDERGSRHSKGRVQSHSPATSSSTHTTTASPAY